MFYDFFIYHYTSYPSSQIFIAQLILVRKLGRFLLQGAQLILVRKSSVFAPKTLQNHRFWSFIALAFKGALCDEPQKHVFERRGPDIGPLALIFSQQRVLTSSTTPPKMNCIRPREPSHRSTEKSRGLSPTPAQHAQCSLCPGWSSMWVGLRPRDFSVDR